jgi:hypothetical protein
VFGGYGGGSSYGSGGSTYGDGAGYDAPSTASDKYSW